MARIDLATQITDINGNTHDLTQYEGRVMLVVNTASRCGFTPQYDGLEALWKQYEEEGLVILAFPCDQFGHQEPGSDEEIAEYCRVNHGVSFPLHAKIEVNGAQAHPLFEQLKGAQPGLLNTQAVKWNFTKFLVGRDGTVLRRFAPNQTPEALKDAIEGALAA